jgi:hypothetical protein
LQKNLQICYKYAFTAIPFLTCPHMIINGISPKGVNKTMSNRHKSCHCQHCGLRENRWLIPIGIAALCLLILAAVFIIAAFTNRNPAPAEPTTIAETTIVTVTAEPTTTAVSGTEVPTIAPTTTATTTQSTLESVTSESVVSIVPIAPLDSIFAPDASDGASWSTLQVNGAAYADVYPNAGLALRIDTKTQKLILDDALFLGNDNKAGTADDQKAYFLVDANGAGWFLLNADGNYEPLQALTASRYDIIRDFSESEQKQALDVYFGFEVKEFPETGDVHSALVWVLPFALLFTAIGTWCCIRKKTEA